jgi:malate/lactate dehydrogenase
MVPTLLTPARSPLFSGCRATISATNLSRLTQSSEYRLQEDVYLSLPALLGRQGLLNVMEQPLTDKERTMLHKSAKGLADVIAGLDNL